MIIDISRIPDEGEHISGSKPASEFDMHDEEFFRFSGPVQYELTVNIVSDELLVRGKLTAEVEFLCTKCASFFVKRIEQNDFNSLVELSDKGESVDLTEDIREAILLVFPGYPVCKSDCRGLCSQCGKDLNKGKCKCKEPTDGQWGELDNLNISS